VTPSSGAIVNTDHTAYQAYMARVSKSRERDRELKEAKLELNNMKMELDELKEMVRQLLNKE
jgi:hypothetical protein